MVSKKDNPNDLTALHDLSEFVHIDDLEADQKFKELESLSDNSGDTGTPQGEDLLVEPAAPDVSIDEAIELDSLPEEEIVEEEIASEVDFDSTLVADISIDLPLATEEEISFDSTLEILTEIEPEILAEIEEIVNEDAVESEPVTLTPPEEEQSTFQEPETFNEVKNFAQNFSYGEIPSGGNPPFSLIVKNIKFKEDGDDILAMLREYKIATPENEKEIVRAIDYGILLIPQINEYLAILLTHKLRRLDCDIEMGLSDKVQPSKSGEYNPRGLTSKTHLKQNKEEHFEFKKEQIPLAEILTSTTPTVAGFKISKYIGVETSFRIIETEDLERLHFIQHSMLNSMDNLDEETKSDYQNFNANFHQIYTDLLNEIKERAFIKSANALLGVSFTLTPILSMPHQAQNKYQLTCTATIASVIPDQSVAINETI